MPRITRVYTKVGDDGSTQLGNGQRVAKDHPRVAAYGAVDELNAAIGVAVATRPADPLRATLARVQNELFHLGAELSVPESVDPERPGPRLELRHVVALETEMDAHLDQLTPLANFVLPGGTRLAAALHVARTACRRAEREIVTLERHEALPPFAIRYLNRLSDALFVWARVANQLEDCSDVLWDSRA